MNLERIRSRRTGEAGRLPRAPVPVVLVLVLLGGACGGEPETGGWTAVVDTVSSTVRVTNAPGAEAGPTRVAREEMRIGTLTGEGPEAFGMIRSIAVLSDGRIAVADGQAEEVRLFDAEGTHLRTFGGRGEGPGELDGMQGVMGDHEGMLRVAEAGNGRLSVFHPDSGFVGSFPLHLFSIGFRGPWGAAMDPGGRTFVASSGQFGEGRYWNMLRVYDPSMVQLDSVPYHDYTDDVYDTEDPPGAWRITLGNGFTFTTVPFYARPHEVLGPTGEFWSSAAGATTLEVFRWTPRGDTTLIVRSTRRPEAVTAAERDSAMADVRATLAERVAGPPSLDGSRVPATKPPVYGLSLDEEGRLWARITSEDAEPTRYDVFAPTGHHVETVAIPLRVDPWIPPVVRGDAIWVVVTDQTDVQYVVRARLESPPRG